MGEFTLDNYPGNAVKYMVWLYFIAATIITNVDFFSLLIAIVSDTFERITESRQFYAIMQRTEIFSDFISMIQIEPLITDNRFLYVMQPVDVNDESSDWSGSLDSLKRLVKKDIDRVKSIIEEG